MSYDTQLDRRIADALADQPVNRKKMFGGICYLINGNMVGGVHKDHLILRLGEEEAAKALQESSAAPFDITGRPMKGWVMVESRKARGGELDRWLHKAVSFVRTLPPK